ncbi:MAG: 50S ribosomal protein L37ae [Candidatus Micrarchaeota archaeon]|nr:50S ribosomal protein L37ae [Candidatus Micrarchaeota archaeon]
MAKAKVRYGAEMRKRADSVDRQRVAKYACPTCGKIKVKRAGHSLWKCRSCGSTFAGGAYSLTTAVGETGRRIIADVKKR